jgi:hypothetical protein
MICVLMFRRMRKTVFASTWFLAAVISAHATTTITFTRAEVNTMANLWETDCVSVSPLPNAQYPSVAGTWDFIFPHSNISSDGDVHIDMAINSAGTGVNSNNTGASPLIAEVINATPAQLNHLGGLSNQQAMFRGIFRFYTEHGSERHFELHPVTQLQLWNGSAFVADSDYHGNITTDPDGTTHSSSVLISAIDGSNTMTAAIATDNNLVNFTFPSPSVNYTQYAGVTVSALQSDVLSQYFLFKPNLVPSVTLRCRLVANTGAATAAATLGANQKVTVNALTRTDMAEVAAQISTMTAGQQKTFGRPIELIVLGLPSVGPSPTPTPTPTPTPSVTPTPTPIGTTFSNGGAIAISGASTGKGSPYPSAISVSGLVGKITKVTAQLNGITEASSNDFASDIDIQMVGPAGQNVMLISDAGGSIRLNNITLGFDDAAAASLPHTTSIANGTYKPTNYTGSSGDTDSFPSPAPITTPGVLLSAYNNINPNGTWNLFVLDEWSSGRGTITGGWSISIATAPAPPDVVTNAATAVTSTTATLNGSINPLGQGSTYQFQLGPDTNYGLTQVIQSAGSGTNPMAVSLVLGGLHPATTYHFRIMGGNSAGAATGTDITFTTGPLTDNDSDGMPDDYESANGLNPNDPLDAKGDPDGDGMTNLQEYIAGTNPRSALSVLRVHSIERSGGDIALTFPSVFGKTYTIDQAPSASGAWVTLTDNIHGTGDFVPALDVEAADDTSQRFYRIIVAP